MDITQPNWSSTDADNDTAAPDGFPEGMAPSGVSDGARAIMGATKRWYTWTVPKLTTGTDTAYVLSYDVAPASYEDGISFLVQFDQTNGAAPTINVNSLGAKSIYYHRAGAWGVIPSGLIDTDEVFRLAYDSSSGVFRMVGFRNRTGVIEEFAGATVPAGALLCDGSAVSRTTYAGLFAVISTTYGVGDGSTTFNVPDHDNKFVQGNGTNGATGGASTHTHTVSASGTISGTATVNLNSGGDFGGTFQVTGGVGGTVANTGHQHNTAGAAPVTGTASVTGTAASSSNLPPFIRQKKIIRT